MNVTERFLKYVAFDTQSNENSESCPSTPNQKLLGAELVREMQTHADDKAACYRTLEFQTPT